MKNDKTSQVSQWKAPFGTETDVQKRLSPAKSEYLETTSIGSRKKREIPIKIPNKEAPLVDDDQYWGAGLTNNELEGQRDHNFNLAPAKNWQIEKEVRPIFTHKPGDLPYIPGNKAHMSEFMSNKFRQENKTPVTVPTAKPSENPDMNYGHPSPNCPGVSIEEAVKRRSDAKAFLKERRIKLKELIN